MTLLNKHAGIVNPLRQGTFIKISLSADIFDLCGLRWILGSERQPGQWLARGPGIKLRAFKNLVFRDPPQADLIQIVYDAAFNIQPAYCTDLKYPA